PRAAPSAPSTLFSDPLACFLLRTVLPPPSPPPFWPTICLSSSVRSLPVDILWTPMCRAPANTKRVCSAAAPEHVACEHALYSWTCSMRQPLFEESKGHSLGLVDHISPQAHCKQLQHLHLLASHLLQLAKQLRPSGLLSRHELEQCLDIKAV